MTKLYRPVGLKEMELILNAESRKFPPRLPSQPIFYPVLDYNYAKQIACEWNTTDYNSGFVGYVTKFDVDDYYISQFKVQTVGKSMHSELWIPAENLKEFNDKISDRITIIEAFYGKNYVGLTPELSLLKNKGLKEQVLNLNRTLEDDEIKFKSEVELQWKVILLNMIYWYKLDLSKDGIDENRKGYLLKKIYDVLKGNEKKLIKYMF